MSEQSSLDAARRLVNGFRDECEDLLRRAGLRMTPEVPVDSVIAAVEAVVAG